MLPQVVITGSRFSDDPQNLPFGVSVITARDLERAGVATVNEAVTKLLGVPGRLDFYGGGDYVLDLRGFGETAGSNQVVVIDGVRLSEGDTSTTRLAGIPIDTVERIEVLRGSGTVLFGEGASGGVIIITTRAGRGNARRTHGQVYAALGSFNTREWRASATVVANEVLSFDLAANRRLSDNHRDNFRSDAQSASVGAQWQGDHARVVVRHSQDEQGGGLPGGLTTDQMATTPRLATTPDDRASLRNQRSTLLAETRHGAWEFALDLGSRDKALRSVNSGSAYDYDVQGRNHGVRARHQHQADGWRNSVVVGLDAASWRRQVLGDFGSRARQHSHALYLRDELALPTGTRLSAGVRREVVDKSQDSGQGTAGTRRAWELGAVQPLDPNVSVFARVGNSFRLPNADEYSYATATLVPQVSRDAELGARWRQGGSRVELRAYQSHLRDEIGFDPSAFGPFDGATATGANVNFGVTRRRGLEVDAVHPISPAISLRANAALRRAQFTGGSNAGRDVPLVPRQTLALGADWQVAAEHRLGASLLHVGSRHPDFQNQCTLPAYTTLDLRYAYGWVGGELSVGMVNATDLRYATQAYRCSDGVTRALYPEAGRGLTAASRWTF